MKKNNLIIVLIIVVLFAIGGFMYSYLHRGVSVRVIYTSEMMGNILDLPCNKSSGDNYFYTMPQILEKVDNLTASAKKSKKTFLYIDGGNSLFGVDHVSASQNGKPALDLLASSGCDAIAAGEQEIRYGLEKIVEIPSGPKLFCGNIRDITNDANGSPDPSGSIIRAGRYFIKKTNDGDIAVFTVFEPYSSPFLPEVKEMYRNFSFSESETAMKELIEATPAKIKILVARVNNPSEIPIHLKGVDLIIPARYDDNLQADKVTYINHIAVAPYVNSRYQGPVVFDISKNTSGKVSVRFSTEKPTGDGSTKREIVKQSIELFSYKYGKQYDKVNSAFLGYGNESLTHTTGDARETPASFVMADMIRSYARSQVAIINLFSVRRSLAGIIRGEDVEWVAPFGNKLVTMDLTGSQIEEIMKLNNRRDTKFLVMSGASIKYEGNGKNTILINGKPLAASETYRVATNDYLAASDKPEYAVFRLGKRINITQIPINGIFLESVLRRKYIGLPPERIGLKSRQEVESLENPTEKISEAYKWGYFDIVYQMCSDSMLCSKDPSLNTIKNEILVYCGLTDTSLLFSGEKKPQPVSDIFEAMSEYLSGNISQSSAMLKSLSEKYPADIRLKRLADAVSECAGTSSADAGEPPKWSKFKGDAHNTGRSPFEGPSGSKIKTAWKYQTYYAIKSSPAVGSDGTIYFGGGDGIFYALSPDGKLKWNYTLGGFILSSPAIGNDGVIYVGSDDAASGKSRRTFRDESPSTAGYLNAINKDGTLKWRFKTGGWTASSPAILKNGNIVVGSNDCNIYCISPDGKLVWSVKTEGKIFSSPAVDENDNIYVGSEDCYLYAVSKEGKVIWKFRAENKFFSSPMITDEGLIYAGNDDDYLYVLNTEGKLQRKQKFPAALTSTPSQGKDGDIYAGCEDGCLYRLSPEGKIKWKFKREDEFFSSPIIDNKGYIYIGCEDNNLYCVSPEGKMVWKFETGDYVESTPVVSPDGKIYLGAEDKFFYAIENAR
ncbi:MAG: PQQ-binding-like beta-propeller repeat protein [Firmicutes bacterium]|nr:PQQ-binding-like beta-propeller repeat protein [Bacillota bacterium]